MDVDLWSEPLCSALGILPAVISDIISLIGVSGPPGESKWNRANLKMHGDICNSQHL